MINSAFTSHPKLHCTIAIKLFNNCNLISSGEVHRRSTVQSVLIVLYIMLHH